MTRKDFAIGLHRHGWRWAEGEHEEVLGLFIGHERQDPPLWFVPFWGIETASDYMDIMRGKHVDYMTRVVGYYSMKSNWNRSKIREGLDRRMGHYSTGPVTGRLCTPRLPEEVSEVCALQKTSQQLLEESKHWPMPKLAGAGSGTEIPVQDVGSTPTTRSTGSLVT